VRRTLITLATTATLLLPGSSVFAQEPPTATSAPGSEPIASGPVEIVSTTLEVDGRTVEAAPPGVEVTLTLGLRNGSDQTLRNITVTLADNGGLRYSRASDRVGDLLPGKTADAKLGFSFDPDACFYFLGIGGEATYDGGSTPLKLAIPASCPGPRLGLGDVTFVGGDGDGVPEPGETLRVFIALVNSGRDAATNVKATIKVSGDGVDAAGTNLTWPDIAPGATERSTAPLILTIASNAPRQQGCQGGGPEPEPAPAPGVVDDQPATGGALPPDQTVSSDGNASSSDPGTGSGSAPGSAGAGAPGSTGTGGAAVEPLPATVEPQPDPSSVEPEPGTVEPDPGTGTVEPGPIVITEPPPPPGPNPNPEPGATDGPVAFQMQIEGSVDGTAFALEYSNQTFCALEGAAFAKDVAARADAARDGTGATGGAVVPILIALGVSAGAVAVRRKVVR